MKVKDIIPYKEEKSKWGNYTYVMPRCRAKEKKLLMKYKDKDCVVAFLNNELYTIFVIRTKQKNFAFISFDSKLKDSAYFMMGFTLLELNLDYAYSIIEKCKGVITNQDEWARIAKLSCMNNLN